MKKRIISLLLTLIFMGWSSLSALAAEVPDLNVKGTVTVTMHSGEAIVAGGTLTLYRVGEIYEDDGNYDFKPTGDFKAWGENFEDIQSPELALDLADYAHRHFLKGITENISEEGIAEFKELEPGLYLLVQQEAAKGYLQANPFLVSLPIMENGKYVYQADASPKVDIEREQTKVPTVPEKPSDSRLPQTGQLNWPIPVMAITGLLLCAFGWILCQGKRKGSDET